MNDLLNALGLATGLVLYAMLLAMVMRDRTRGGRFDSVPLATAILGIVWNVCSLSMYVLPRIGILSAARAVSVSGVIALGLLPAVVVHSVVRGPRGSRWARANAVLLGVAPRPSELAASGYGIDEIQTGAISPETPAP